MNKDATEAGRRALVAAFATKPTPARQRRYLPENLPHSAFLYAPDPVFPTALTIAIEQLGRWYGQSGSMRGQEITETLIAEINLLFATRAVPYRVDADFEVRWHGDEMSRSW